MGKIAPGATLQAPATVHCEHKTRMYILNPHPLAYRVRVHSACQHNELIALTRRHIIDRSYIQFSRSEWLKAARLTRSLLIEAAECQVTSVTNVIMGYRGGKRAVYTRAAERLSELRHAHSTTNLFVKPDKVDEDLIDEKAPRAIQYRSAVYNLKLATYLKPLEHNLYNNLLNDNGTPVIAKGKNQKQRAEHILQCFQDKPHILMLDHSKFDSTINVEHLKTEHGIYNSVFKSRTLQKLLSWQLNNRGYTRSGIRYKVRGTRMSGDYNTGLGNCIINYIAIRGFLAKFGVKGHIYLDGDDSLVFIDKCDLGRLDFGYFEKLGFETTHSDTDQLEKAEFCQCNYIHGPNVLVRKPGRAISNAAISLKNSNHFRIRAGVRLGELSLNHGVPVLQAWFDSFGQHKKPIFDKPYFGHEGSDQISDQARISFYNAFNIEPDLQEILEVWRPCTLCNTLHNKEILCPSLYNADSTLLSWQALV